MSLRNLGSNKENARGGLRAFSLFEPKIGFYTPDLNKHNHVAILFLLLFAVFLLLLLLFTVFLLLAILGSLLFLLIV